MPAKFETKWIKVSPAKIRFYEDVVDYFFDDDDLCFRALIAEKANLNHEKYNQTHDTWYYKMYFSMLKTIITPKDNFRIYLDIKDARGYEKICKLHEILCNNIYDFDKNIIERVQHVRSHEVEILQLADLLIGAVGYANRNCFTSSAKTHLVDKIKKRSNYKLTSSTLLRESKFNLFHWQPKETGNA